MQALKTMQALQLSMVNILSPLYAQEHMRG